MLMMRRMHREKDKFTTHTDNKGWMSDAMARDGSDAMEDASGVFCMGVDSDSSAEMVKNHVHGCGGPDSL